MTEAHTHGADDLCGAGLTLYVRALRVGRVSTDDTDEAPCLVGLGLLDPEPGNAPGRLRPVAPAATLGSESRAQLGYLIGQSGILDPPG
ncbi:hypothetical protein OG194_21875 [Streptomyces sp. NBC_01288]|uniref:hypothetical protein n=1 Tax=Streptomyces sp. NBC_01288 TaxID=2903814 RepID=UPI002E165205|nr:hypothetical protein OG194_21875 [Streptomyces sp. NBC_01288]